MTETDVTPPNRRACCCFQKGSVVQWLVMINVEVQHHGNESTTSLMRRFSRKSQSSGVVKRMRSIRYHEKAASATQRKKNALARIKRTETYVKLTKEGREPPTKKKRR